MSCILQWTVSVEMTMNLKSKTIDSDPHLTNIKMRQDIKLQNCSESVFFWKVLNISKCWFVNCKVPFSGEDRKRAWEHIWLQNLFELSGLSSSCVWHQGVTVFKVKKYEITWPLILQSVQWPLISLWWYWRTDSRSKARGVFYLCFWSLWP